MRWLIGVLATVLAGRILFFIVAFGHRAPTVLIVLLILTATTPSSVVAVDTYRRTR